MPAKFKMQNNSVQKFMSSVYNGTLGRYQILDGLKKYIPTLINRALKNGIDLKYWILQSLNMDELLRDKSSIDILYIFFYIARYASQKRKKEK